MAGLERPAELSAAPLRGPEELRCQLWAWEPDPLDSLLAPAGATAELVALDPPATIGGDFDQRAFRRAWLILTTADGRGLMPGTRGQVLVPPGTIAEVIFREAGRVDGPAPHAGLERLFLQLLGPSAEQLHAVLDRQIKASGDPGQRAFEPAALDPPLRPAFWRFYGFRQRARDLDAQLAQLAGLDDTERAALVRLVATARDQAFRDGMAIGAALQARGLEQHLGGEIRATRRVRKAQKDAGETSAADERRVALANEQALFSLWRKHRTTIRARALNAYDTACALLRETPTDANFPSAWTVLKMIRWWDRGHDPTISDAPTWRELQDGKASL